MLNWTLEKVSTYCGCFFFKHYFFGEGSPTKIDYRKKATLVLSSLLEDLVRYHRRGTVGPKILWRPTPVQGTGRQGRANPMSRRLAGHDSNWSRLKRLKMSTFTWFTVATHLFATGCLQQPSWGMRSGLIWTVFRWFLWVPPLRDIPRLCFSSRRAGIEPGVGEFLSFCISSLLMPVCSYFGSVWVKQRSCQLTPCRVDGWSHLESGS